MFRLLFGLAFFAAFILGFIYLAPDPWKETALTKITRAPIIPQELKEVAENILGTPAYRRKKLIESLEENLKSLKERLLVGREGEAFTEEQNALLPLITESEELLQELKKENAEISVTNTATKKIIEKLIEEQLTSKQIECATSTSAN